MSPDPAGPLEPGATCSRLKEYAPFKVAPCGRLAVDRDPYGVPRCAVHRGTDAATVKRKQAAADRRRARQWVRTE